MVQLSLGVRYTRVILFVLNIFFLLVGFTVMGIGISIKASGHFSAISQIYDISETLGDEVMQWVGIGMIITGILTVCLAIFGSVGVIKKSQCILYIYTLLLALIIAFEFVAVIMILVFRQNIWQTYDSGFERLFHHAYEKNQTKTIGIIENLEREYQCCGVNGVADYREHGYPIPDSCHPHQSKMYHPFSKGCAEAVVTWVWDRTPIIVGILSGILFIELFGVISSLAIAVALSHANRPISRYAKI